MTKSVKEFLEKRPKNILYYSFFDDSNMAEELSKQLIQPDNVIDVKDFGEFAWKNFVDNYTAFKKPIQPHFIPILKDGLWWDFAINCLGIIECEKRLSEL